MRTPQHGTVLDIKDARGDVKGKIEFRQINEPLLAPVLNIVTVNTKETGADFSTVISDLNDIYNTMNVDWQKGEHIELTINQIKNINIQRERDEIIETLRKNSDYKENQYYMIVSSELGEDKGGFTTSLNTNWFIASHVYNKNVPVHELGHCNGLDEFVINIGLLSSSNRAGVHSNNIQSKSTNIMGYSSMIRDFYSWQIPVIRENISKRINKK